MKDLNCMATLAAVTRQAAHIDGERGPTLVLGAGFGCNQDTWHRVAPALAQSCRVLRFDYIGMGRSDRSAYDLRRHGRLEAHAEDLVELLQALQLPRVTFVGHSVGATIGWLAAAMAPQCFASLVLLAPSPRYVDDPGSGYVGGFTPEDIHDLLETMDSNFLGWSRAIAPLIMGRADLPELADELADTFCRNDPDIAQHFARVTFLSDHREDLERVKLPTTVLQCSADAIADEAVGRYVHRRIAGSRYERLDARGHCPHLSAPQEVVEALRRHLQRLHDEAPTAPGGLPT